MPATSHRRECTAPEAGRGEEQLAGGIERAIAVEQRDGFAAAGRAGAAAEGRDVVDLEDAGCDGLAEGVVPAAEAGGDVGGGLAGRVDRHRGDQPADEGDGDRDGVGAMLLARSFSHRVAIVEDRIERCHPRVAGAQRDAPGTRRASQQGAAATLQAGGELEGVVAQGGPGGEEVGEDVLREVLHDL